MKITVKVDEVSICIDESDNPAKDKKATLAFERQTNQIQSTLRVMCEEAVKLRKASLEAN